MGGVSSARRSAPARATTSQRYHDAPSSASSRLGVNHTLRSMLSRSASGPPPTKSPSAAGQRSATPACTASESTASRCPSTTVSSGPASKVTAVWGLAHRTGGADEVGATASSYDRR